MIKSIAISALFFLVGCVTRGTDFPERTDWIIPNVTTQQDALRLLGKPMMVGKSTNRSTWTYGLYNYKLIGDSDIKELKLYWNSDRTISSFSYHSTLEDSQETKVVESPKSDVLFPSH